MQTRHLLFTTAALLCLTVSVPSFAQITTEDTRSNVVNNDESTAPTGANIMVDGEWQNDPAAPSDTEEAGDTSVPTVDESDNESDDTQTNTSNDADRDSQTRDAERSTQTRDAERSTQIKNDSTTETLPTGTVSKGNTPTIQKNETTLQRKSTTLSR